MGGSRGAIGFLVFVVVFAIVTLVIFSVITGTDTGSTFLKAIGPITLAAGGIIRFVMSILPMGRK